MSTWHMSQRGVTSLKTCSECEPGHVSKDFYEVLLKWCLLNTQRAGALKWDNLAQCFVYQCRTRPTDPGAMSLSRALCLSLLQSYSPQIWLKKSPFLSQNDCISGGQWAVRVELPSVCCETAQCHLSAWFPGPARRTTPNRILWTRGFLFKKQEMVVEALGRRHDWMRIQIVWEWENGGLEFGVDIHGNVFWGSAYKPPLPFSFSQPSFSFSLSVFRFFLGGARLKTERP